LAGRVARIPPNYTPFVRCLTASNAPDRPSAVTTVKATVMKALLGFLLLFAATGAQGETITFEADNTVKFIRCVDFVGGAKCEFIAPVSDATYVCIALDADDEPLASEATYAAMGQVVFLSLDHTKVVRIVCRDALSGL